jgi:hypothetical protein
MTDASDDSLSIVLTDIDPEETGSLQIRVLGNRSSISIFPEGHGDFGSAEGHGCPIFLELRRGRLRLVVIADINHEDPRHVIDLEGSRTGRRGSTPASKAITPLEQGRLYCEMLSEVNPKTGRHYTMREAAALLGVKDGRFRNLVALQQPLRFPTRRGRTTIPGENLREE